MSSRITRTSHCHLDGLLSEALAEHKEQLQTFQKREKKGEKKTAQKKKILSVRLRITAHRKKVNLSNHYIARQPASQAFN